jgi:hypothetical protein
MAKCADLGPKFASFGAWNRFFGPLTMCFHIASAGRRRTAMACAMGSRKDGEGVGTPKQPDFP